MSRPLPLSGFPEWLPGQQVVAQRVLDTLRRTFELHGFAPVHTRAVETLDWLAGESEANKEIYLLRRLHDEDAGDTADADPGRRLGLHFDLTVPFARYVVENAGRLTFPFRRYQIQQVWRGERPQEGRFREFTQADIDVVGDGELPFHYDVELPLVMADALRALPIPPVRMLVNNRKLAEGFYRGLGVPDVPAALRAVDKLDKVGPQGVADELAAQAGATDAQAKACLRLAEISSDDLSFADQVRALGVSDPLLDEGLDELSTVVEEVREHAPGLVVADLRIARGLDYYTGTVYETLLAGHEDLGSICSGGRYDNLASAGGRRYPGVGLSVGVTRLLSRLLGAGLVRASRPVPTAVLIALHDEAGRPAANQLAATFRERGIATEVSPTAAKYGKQIRYADRRGIPYVWFPGSGEQPHQVKDLRSGEQVDADPTSWAPPPADAWPGMVT
ncbi:MAG: histidine--tRNA ligase [Actinomycetota bacterium]